MKEKIRQWIAFHLPKGVLIWCVARAFAIASRANPDTDIKNLTYTEVFDAVKDYSE